MDTAEFELRLTNLAKESIRSSNYQVQRAGAAITIVLGMYMDGKADIVATDLCKYLPKGLYNMSVEEFFTVEAFMECGAPQRIATRAKHTCLNACSVKNPPDVGGFTRTIRTAGQFKDKYHTEEALLQIRDLGKRCVPFVMLLLNEID